MAIVEICARSAGMRRDYNCAAWVLAREKGVDELLLCLAPVGAEPTAQQRMFARRTLVALASLPHCLGAVGKVEQMTFVGQSRGAVGEVHRARGVELVIVFFAHGVELPEHGVNGAVG